MRWIVVAILVALTMLSPAVHATTSGRDSSYCPTRDIENVTNSINLNSGICVTINLGILQPGDVYEVNLSIINDAVDVLLFDQAQILTYNNGQSYRTQYHQAASTENALGGYNFHWQIPVSLSAKAWYLVIDNLAHPGDGGQGDQGGSQSQIGIVFNKLVDDSYWTPYHDVLAVQTDSYDILLSGDSLRLDAGTTVAITVWQLEGQADVYLQTRAMYDLYTSALEVPTNQLFIEQINLQAVTDSKSDSWVVPEELAGQELLVVVDNTDKPAGGAAGDSDIRVTVRVELMPIIQPIIEAENMGKTSLGLPLNFNAQQSPNSQDQIETFSWDFDAAIDADSDGNSTNDNDATGIQVAASWDSIGDKVITLTVISQTSQVEFTNYTVNVSDLTPPNPIITSSARSFNDGWKVEINQETAFSCSASTDDSMVELCLWQWGANMTKANNSVLITWRNLGTYEINLSVTDAAGNSATISNTVVVVDLSIPEFNNASIDILPSNAIQDEALSLTIIAVDDYDQSYQLTYHWDLEPSIDSDGNGNPKDDPDFIGSSVDIEFLDSGRKDIVVTVFDQSGNSASHPFSINVASSGEPNSVVGLIAITLFILVITMSVSMIGYRRWQTGLAVELLQGRGLSETEAKHHITTIKQQRKVPLFASSTVIAGLDSSQKVLTKQQQQEAATNAEYQSIYGSESREKPGSAFAPPTNASSPANFNLQQHQFSTRTKQVAADAMALLAEEENKAIIDAYTVESLDKQVTEVVSGGVQLPNQVKNKLASDSPKPSNNPVRSVNCPLCDAVVKITLPDVKEAIVECPSCSKDFKLKFK